MRRYENIILTLIVIICLSGLSLIAAKALTEKGNVYYPPVENISEYSETPLQDDTPPDDDPVIERPVSEAPVVEGPIIDEPIPEDTITNGSSAEEPVPEDTPAEEPAVDQPVAEDPPVEVPAYNSIVDNEPQYKTYLISKGNSVNVRTSPSTDSTILGTVDAGDGLPLLGVNGNWYKTVYKRKIAYVYATYFDKLDIKVGSDVVEKVISEAEKLLGFTYVYGATRLHDGNGIFYSGFDNSKFDCSSLTQYVFYYGADLNLALTTRTQIKQGVHVDASQLKRGDVIFFTNSSRVNNVGIERVGHVAIYLGNNYIIHTASDHTVIEPMTQTRWNYYIEARRMI